MYEEYEREQKIVDKTEKEKEIELITAIIHVREELKTANRNFDYADADLVDYYTYQIKANQSKLDYLIKKAKANGIVVDMINELKYRFYSQNNEARIKIKKIC
jgi:hypothetical protein